jgi:hypothetical protein
MKVLERVFPCFRFSMAVSSLISFFWEDNSCCEALSELYSSNEITITPVFLPLLMIKGSKLTVTSSKYFFKFFLNSERVRLLWFYLLLFTKHLQNLLNQKRFF